MPDNLSRTSAGQLICRTPPMRGHMTSRALIHPPRTHPMRLVATSLLHRLTAQQTSSTLQLSIFSYDVRCTSSLSSGTEPWAIQSPRLSLWHPSTVNYPSTSPSQVSSRYHHPGARSARCTTPETHAGLVCTYVRHRLLNLFAPASRRHNKHSSHDESQLALAHLNTKQLQKQSIPKRPGSGRDWQTRQPLLPARQPIR